jgi:alpha-2-macroglobulin
MEQLTQDTNIVVQREGTGRLYYRLGVRYAPTDLTLDPRDEGFVVDRVYEPVDDPGDVTRDPDGTWQIRAGATVRVRVTMVADARRTHVALVDPLPAGLEPVNPALQVSQTFAPEESSSDARMWCWCWQWFEHQNMRDDRVEAFTSYLEGGTYEYTYIARATTPGQFVVPPAKAEELYAPEVFGRSASATVVVA